MSLLWTKILAASALFILSLASPDGQTVKVMISGGFSAAYHELGPQFEKSSHDHLETVAGPSMGETPEAIPVRLSRGETADVVIMARAALDILVKKGNVIEGSQTDLARSRIGMAIRVGAPVPDISTVDAFRRTLLAAKSVAFSDSASGVYISKTLFKRLGIEKEMAAKSRQIPAEPVGLVVARGEAEIGFQQMSELNPIHGITIVGEIPDPVQQVTVFSAGVLTQGANKDGAKSLIHYLSSPSACSIIEKSALEPVACPKDR